MILQETYTLANGIAIPSWELGTWFIDNNKAAQAVRTAVGWVTGSSIRLRPTATRRGVGEGIRTCGLKREELFVASKVAAGTRPMRTPPAPLTRRWRKWA